MCVFLLTYYKINMNGESKRGKQNLLVHLRYLIVIVIYKEKCAAIPVVRLCHNDVKDANTTWCAEMYGTSLRNLCYDFPLRNCQPERQGCLQIAFSSTHC